ncbi:MAG: hypothetical protein M1839_002790 [Geoglossum umbratile]|nr:MAG: hypothetical protein M1839_002790 [Geoglossum umbratile]
MSPPCSPTASPNRRKRACPDEDTKVEADVQMEDADGNGQAVLSSPIHMLCDDSPGAANKKARVEVTDDDFLTGENPETTVNKEVMQDLKARLGEVGKQSGAAPLTSNKPPLPTKRKKLTLAEKQALDQEKARKKAQRDEEKRLKDEEKRKKEDERRKREEEKAEDKRRKEEEREEKNRVKEEERKVKEEEKKKKEEERRLREEEKLKKAEAKRDRSQLSLSSFLSRPSTSVTSTARRRTATPDKAVECEAQSNPASQSPPKTDYQRAFAPFFVKAHVTLAPRNRWCTGEEGMEEFRRTIDEFLENRSDSERPARTATLNISKLCHIPPSARLTRGIIPRHTMKEIMVKLNESVKDLGTAQNPVKIPSSSRHKKKYFGPMEAELLKSIPMKYLEFHEDVRPPYRGTFTKQPPADIVRSVSRNPTQRKLPNINYDYDSEAVWDPEEEGEDLDSEGEQEDATDDDADDMEGFLDDEDAPEASGAVNKRRAVLSDLIPVCSGLCWDDGTGMANGELNDYKMEVILSSAQVPIDPFSTSYWHTVRPGSSSSADANTSGMHPPRVPLQAIGRSHRGVNGSSASQANMAAGPAIMVAAGDMGKFKAAIQGSNLTKAGLIEVLKKQFPEIPKTAIRNTLNCIAERVGHKEVDKRWVLINGA